MLSSDNAAFNLQIKTAEGSYYISLHDEKSPSSSQTPSIRVGGRSYYLFGESAHIACALKLLGSLSTESFESIEALTKAITEFSREEAADIEGIEKTHILGCNILSDYSLEDRSTEYRSDQQLQVTEHIVPRLCPADEAVQPRTIEQKMQDYNIKGVSVTVINNGHIEWSEGFGNLEDQNTLIQAASISKSVAALTVLSLIEDGLIPNGLDTDVRDILGLELWHTLDPDNKTEDGKFPVTIRGLLSHTAGIILGDGQSGFQGYPRPEIIEEEIHHLENELKKLHGDIAQETQNGEKIAELEKKLNDLRIIEKGLPNVDGILRGDPGVNSGKIKVNWRPDPNGQMRYQGGGTTILQKVIENIVEQATNQKKPYADIVKERVFDKLGMSHSCYSPEGRPITQGYGEDGQPIAGGWRIYPELAAAGLWSTPSDLAKMAIEVQKAYKGRSRLILGKELAQEMLCPLKGLGVAVPPIHSEQIENAERHLAYLKNKRDHVRKGSSGRAKKARLHVQIAIHERRLKELKAQRSTYFFHEGANAGFRCIMLGNVNGQGAVIMTNGNNGKELCEEILSSIADVYGWKDAKQVDMLEPLMNVTEAKKVNPQAWLQKCEGSYHFNPTPEESISLKIFQGADKKIMGQVSVRKKASIENEEPFEIIPVSETRACFRTTERGPYKKMDIRLNEENAVTSVEFYGDQLVRSD